MDNRNSIIQYLIQQKINEEQNNALGSDNSSLGKIKQLTGNASSLGSNLSATGNFLKDNVNNELAQKFGSSMANLGGNITGGANAVSDTLNAPGNYFKGYANRAVGQGLSKIGSSLAGNSGAIGSIGQSLSNLGTSMAGTGAAAGTTAASGAAAGTAAGAGAAGAGAAGAAAGASGAAAGGAAAGGGAASGAAAAGPVGALVALGVMALQGTNRKRAKKSGEQLLNATNEMATNRQKNNLAATQESMEALQNQSQQNLLNGVMTGGAAPIQDTNASEVPSDFPMTREAFAKSLYDNGWDNDTVNAALEGRNLGNKEMDNYIKYYNSVAPQDQQLVAAAQNAAQTGNVTANNEVKSGLLNKFLNGITDLSRGYDENRNTAFKPENLTQDKFANTTTGQSEVLTNYQNQLRNNGIDENVVNAVAQGKNSGNKDIANWISNNVAALNPVEQTTYTDKSKMARLGEALGTTSRFLNRPGVQGLVAGGLSAALTGDPLYGLGQGYKFANQRAMSDIYQNALREQGVEVSSGMFGALDSRDMTALMTPKYKQQENDLKKVYYDALANYRAGMLENAKKKTEIDEAYKGTKAANDTIKANASMIKATKTGTKGGGTRTAAKKPQDHPDWGNDLSGFYQIVTNPRLAAKSDVARARFVQKYGVDPMKYVKL